MVEDMELKIIALRSTWMALPPYQIWKSTKRCTQTRAHAHTRRLAIW